MVFQTCPNILILDLELLFNGKVSCSYFLPVLTTPRPLAIDCEAVPWGLVQYLEYLSISPLIALPIPNMH